MKRKGIITEGDVALLLRRYSATTVLALLQEVAKCASVKLDWNTLVKNTATGITNVREYQMLWRHLAYHQSLAEKYEDDAQPLDDDSDLEFEIEPFPAVGADASAEAAACVRVLATSGTTNNIGHSRHSTVEAPLTINIPSAARVSDVQLNNQQSTISTQGMNITVPVSIQKQHLPAVSSSEGVDGNTSTCLVQPVRKKRKLWTLEEDKELIAAVQKCGEGNWASILKGAFKHDRTASQLSQRWSLIRKRQVASNQGSLANSTALSGNVDVQQAAAQAAVNATVTVSTTVAPTIVTANTSGTAAVTTCISSTQPMASTGLGISLTQPTGGPGSDNSTSQLHQPHQALEQGVVRGSASCSNSSASIPSIKSRPTPKKQVANAAGGTSTGRTVSAASPVMSAAAVPVCTVGRTETRQGPMLTKTAVSLPAASPGSGRHGNASAVRPGISEALGRGSLKGPHPMVQAAAVAAGARIAPASAAASLLKAAQSGNVVHIGPGGVPLAKSGHTNQAGAVCGAANSTRSSAGGVGARASNVHYIRTGSIPSPPVYSGIVPSVQRLSSSQPKSHVGRASATGQSTHQSSRTNLMLASTLPATQCLANSAASQSQSLNHTNQGSCPSLNAPVHSSRVKLKSQTGSSATESMPIDASFPVPSAIAAMSSAEQASTEQVTLISPKGPVSPLTMVTGVSDSSTCPVVHSCESADVPADLSSISVFPENAILNEDTAVQEVKISELAIFQSSSVINTNSLQQPACSERNRLSEYECANIEAKIEVCNENNVDIIGETKSEGTCIPGWTCETFAQLRKDGDLKPYNAWNGDILVIVWYVVLYHHLARLSHLCHYCCLSNMKFRKYPSRHLFTSFV